MKTMFIGVIIVAIIALIALVAVVMMNDSNNQIIQQQEARLNELELMQQMDREMEVCKNHALVYDFDSFYNCMDGIVSNPNYVLDPQAVANYKMERDRHFAQANSINLANCDFNDMQRMQINALNSELDGSGSVDPNVAFQQIMQIYQQACN